MTEPEHDNVSHKAPCQMMLQCLPSCASILSKDLMVLVDDTLLGMQRTQATVRCAHIHVMPPRGQVSAGVAGGLLSFHIRYWYWCCHATGCYTSIKLMSAFTPSGDMVAALSVRNLCIDQWEPCTTPWPGHAKNRPNFARKPSIDIHTDFVSLP